MDEEYQELLQLLRDGVTDIAPVVEDMARDRQDIVHLLMAIASQEPGEETWDRFVAAIDEAETAEALPQAIQDVLPILDTWPDELRMAPQSWWNLIQESGTTLVQWETVRYLQTLGSHHGFAPCQQESSLTLLTHINVVDDVVFPDQLAQATHLETLSYQPSSFSQLDHPEDLEAIGQLQQLRSLRLTLVRNPDLQPLAALTNLQELSLTFTLHGISEPVDLNPIGNLSQLKSLKLLEETKPFASLEPLTRLTQLVALKIKRPPADLSPLTALAQLQDLELSQLSQGSSNLPLPDCVRSIQLFDAAELRTLDGFAPLSQLQTLKIFNAPALEDSSALAQIISLQSLLLQGTHLSALHQIGNLDRLETLHLNNHSQLVELTVDREQRALQELVITQCPQLANLTGLTPLKGLRRLVLNGLSILEDLSPLQALDNLNELILENCPQIQSVTPLTQISALRTLYLHHCSALRDSEVLASVPHLQVMTT